MGDEFEGVLVSDFYGAYNVYQGPHQRCWTHLLRDIHQLNEQYPQDSDLARWSQQVREVYDRARAYPGPEPGLPETVRRSRRVKQQQQYQQQLWAICQPHLGSDVPMRVLCQRVERFLPELFTFIAEPQASADNNAAGTEPAATGGEPEDQRRDPFGAGERDQEHPGFLVRNLAPARTQPLPSLTIHPLQTPSRSSLNTYKSVHGNILLADGNRPH